MWLPANKKTEVTVFQRVHVLICNDATPEAPTLIVLASVESDAEEARYL